MLLPDPDSSGALRVAEDILQAIRALQIEHAAHPLGKVTASAGITTCRPSRESVSPASLLKAADACLYAAKRAGRNRCCTDAS